MVTDGLYQDLISIGITQMTINLKLQMREVNDGYQEIYLYGGSGSDNLLWSDTDYEYGGTGANTNWDYEEWTPIMIDLNKLQNVDYLYVRYSADGFLEDDWQNNILYIEMMFVVEESDRENPAFTWESNDPEE